MKNPILKSVYNLSYYILENEETHFLQEPTVDHIFLDALLVEASEVPKTSDRDYFQISRAVATAILILSREYDFDFVLHCKEVDIENRSEDDDDWVGISSSDLYDDVDDEDYNELPSNWVTFAVSLSESVEFHYENFCKLKTAE